MRDAHRGRGTWRRARDGIAIARAEGFRVRVAATVAPAEDDHGGRAAFHELLDGIGIPREDQVIRPVAARGFAADGVAVTCEAVGGWLLPLPLPLPLLLELPLDWI